MIKERCWFSQINFFINVLSTSDQDFVSFQPMSCHPHTQIRIILFHDEQRDIPNLEFSPIHVSIGLSQIAFPIIVLPKDDHTDFAQEERPGSSILDHDFGHLCRGRRIQMSGHSVFGIFNNFVSIFHFFLGYKPLLRLLLVHRNLAIWR